MACCAGRTARPATLAATKSDTEEHHCQDRDLGLEEEREGGKCASTTGSRMSAAPRRPRPGDSRPEQNNDLALSERDQQQGLNGGGGDSRERSGSRRGRRRVASLRGGEKGRARQNQGQVGETAQCRFFLFSRLLGLCVALMLIIQFIQLPKVGFSSGFTTFVQRNISFCVFFVNISTQT